MEKNLTIKDIEALNEEQFREQYPDAEMLEIKGFHVYLVDFGGYFQFSRMVFGDGRQIRWADDFQIHHPSRPPEKLRDIYLKNVRSILFTEKELAKPLKSYSDFERRRKFITELLPLKRDFLSMFRYFANKEEEIAYEEAKAKHTVFIPPAFGSFLPEDKEFADHIGELFLQLCQQEMDTANNYEYNFNAFYYELGNHEYHINYYQGDWDTLSAFGNIEWHGQGEEARQQYYKELDFTEVQIKAFEDARKKYLREAAKHGY